MKTAADIPTISKRQAILIAALALASLSGCINWQGSYDQAARDDCRRIANPDERRACLDSVERNASEKRAERRT